MISKIKAIIVKDTGINGWELQTGGYSTGDIGQGNRGYRSLKVGIGDIGVGDRGDTNTNRLTVIGLKDTIL